MPADGLQGPSTYRLVAWSSCVKGDRAPSRSARAASAATWPLGSADPLSVIGFASAQLPAGVRWSFVIRTAQAGVGRARPAVGRCLAGWPRGEANCAPGLFAWKRRRASQTHVGWPALASRCRVCGAPFHSSRVTSQRFRPEDLSFPASPPAPRSSRKVPARHACRAASGRPVRRAPRCRTPTASQARGRCREARSW